MCLNDLRKVIWNKGSIFLNVRLMNVGYIIPSTNYSRALYHVARTVLWGQKLLPRTGLILVFSELAVKGVGDDQCPSESEELTAGKN